MLISTACSQGRPSASIIDRDSGLPMLATGKAPWPAERAHLKERLEMLGLPPTEGTAVHIEPQLRLFILGKEHPIPKDIGMASPDLVAPIHTHDATGIIHVESPTHQIYTLGDVFAVWGVRFTRRCIGGYCSRAEHQLRVYVGGREVSSDPAAYSLRDFEVIVVAFGNTEELPVPIPTNYQF